MPRKTKHSVVVITGASSGIGRATAERFAKKGATVVLAARRRDALDQVVAHCERLGGQAIAVPCDVAKERDVLRVAETALEHFGRIDVWVNNAAVTMFGRTDEVPLEDMRRVIDTNLFGYIHGARAAITVFREQGNGVLINVGSVVSEVAQPYTSAYSITKAGVRALSTSLRQEIMLDGVHDIHVTTVLPATIDTPLFQQAANYTGRAVRAMEPFYPPEQVAKEIVHLSKHPEAERYVGKAGKLLARQHKWAPHRTERSFARLVESRHLDQDRRAPPTSGNLYQPMPEHAKTDGGWRAQSRGKRAIGRALQVATVAAVGTALYRWYRSQSAGGQRKPFPDVGAHQRDTEVHATVPRE